MKKVNEYVAAKCTAKAWTHIPQAAETELDAAYFDWNTAYEITLKPCTPTDKAEKRRIRRVSEKTLRDFINIYLRFHPDVTNADKENMGLHIPDTTRTTIEPPKTEPIFHIVQLGPRILGIVFQDGERRRGSKPENVEGARVHYGVFDTPPADQEELPASKWATRCPYRIEFRESDRGKRAYFSLRWEIRRENGEGPWSEIESELIP
jgi:hypothetical protein